MVNLLLIYRWRIALALMLPWFFIGGPDYESPRLIKEVWNLGHIIFFAVFSLEAKRYWTTRRLATRGKSLRILLLVLVLATSVEICQSFLPERVANLQDILFGLAGSLAIIAWQEAGQQSINRKIFLRSLGIVVVVLCIIPLFLVAIDDYRQWRDFPVLSDFESFLDVSRWGAKGRAARVKNPVKQGRYALMVQLSTDKYSGIGLSHFPENWSAARALTFSVYNPGEPLTLYYRVHDWKHQGTNQDYSERFNGHSILASGWNTVKIDIAKIENGPKNRKMDVKHIRGFGLFVVEQPVARILYIDEVQLLQK